MSVFLYNMNEQYLGYVCFKVIMSGLDHDQKQEILQFLLT
ncbi:hypothetical protein ACI0FR_02615 [Paenochrobactrum sp. BZR 201-1]